MQSALLAENPSKNEAVKLLEGTDCDVIAYS